MSELIKAVNGKINLERPQGVPLAYEFACHTMQRDAVLEFRAQGGNVLMMFKPDENVHLVILSPEEALRFWEVLARISHTPQLPLARCPGQRRPRQLGPDYVIFVGKPQISLAPLPSPPGAVLLDVMCLMYSVS